MRPNRIRAGVLALLLTATVAGAALITRDPGNETLCQASLPFRVIDGREVAVQDKDPLGGDCDLDQTMPGMDTLGLDCKVRSPDGTVITTLRSSRDDGTCGMDSPPSDN